MSGTAVDNILQRLRSHSEKDQGKGEIAARFLVTKLSWRGNYRRILIITSAAVVTLHPDSLAVTNAWSFVGDHDISAIEVADGPENFILHLRKDKKGLKNRDAKFSCKARASLLTVLYDAIATATARGLSGAGPTLLGHSLSTGTREAGFLSFKAYKLRKNDWVPVVLRVTPTSLERIDPDTGVVKWRWSYMHASSPAIRLLASTQGSPAGKSFALSSKIGRSPRVYATEQRDTVVRAIQTAALKYIGIALAADASVVESLDGKQLLSMVSAAERERAATPSEAPIGEWEVLKVRNFHALTSTTSASLQASTSQSSQSLSSSIFDASSTGGVNAVVSRRLVLTTEGLIERRPATYEVAEWRQLASIAALVRYSDDPQLLGIEWSDESPRSVYVTPARDALLAGILYTAQAVADRPIPILPNPTDAGDVVTAEHGQSLCAPVTSYMEELERIMLTQLTQAATAFLGAGGNELSLNALALAGLTAATVENDKMNSIITNKPDEAPQQSLMLQNEGSSSMVSGSGSSMHTVAVFEHRIRAFNANIPYSGVNTSLRMDEPLISALLSYLPKQQAAGSQPTLGSEESRLVIMALHCLQRLSSSPFVATQIVGSAGGAGRIFSALLSRHDHVATEAARILFRLFSPAAGRTGASLRPPTAAGTMMNGSPKAMLGATEDAAAARNAKSVCFISDSRCAALLAPLRGVKATAGKKSATTATDGPSTSPPSPLLAGAIIEVVAAVACKPGSRNTEFSTWEALLQEAGSLGRPLFMLFNHPAKQIGDVAAMVMQAVAEGGATAASPMREAALSDGAVLHHLLRALGPPTSATAQLSRQLIALWADAHEPTLRLLQRIFPPGLLRYLDEPKKTVVPVAVRRLGPPDRRSTLLRSYKPHAGHHMAPTMNNTQHDGALQHSDPLQSTSSSPLPSGYDDVNALDRAPTTVSSSDAHPKPALSSQPSTNEDHYSNDFIAAEQEQQQQQPPSSIVAPYLLSGGPRPSSPQLRGNWGAFWTAVDKDHAHAALIWNERTRSELREALQAEENALRLGRQRVADSGGASPAWNSAEFSVSYPSLASHLIIGGVHIKLLLDSSTSALSTAINISTNLNRNQGEDLQNLIRNPKEFFTAAHLHFLRQGDLVGVALPGSNRSMRNTDPANERELCLRAMTVVYSLFAADIGPFEGMQHIVDLLDSSPSRSMRQRLLGLIKSLVCPTPPNVDTNDCSSSNTGNLDRKISDDALKTRISLGLNKRTHSNPLQDPTPSNSDAHQLASKIQYIAQSNAGALVSAGGVEILVDLVSTAHEASERSATAHQTGLIASTPHTEAIKVWYYIPNDAINELPKDRGVSPGEIAAVFDQHKVGPVTKAEIRQLYARGTIDASTPFWTVGMPQNEPVPLSAIRELRWWVSSSASSPWTAFETAHVALEVLTALARLRPAIDSRGEAVIPLPAAHRQMTSPRCLPHIAQVALTAEPSLVASVCTLLLELVKYNEEAMSGLYLSGVFFFLLAYCGNNIIEMAKLFKASHLKQKALVASAIGPMSKRSFLGPTLPESLLYILESYGPEEFAAALAGDANTPEIIWTHRMRGQRLVPQMLKHIGDLPRRLAECCTYTVYDYTPCPPVGYPEISEEVWCHRYYLRHLCDPTQFPDWPIVDHVALLQALLETWRAELVRKPLGLSAADAARVLGLNVDSPESITEESLKAAYRRLARQYHPDRNPQGRDAFEAVQRAYEALQEQISTFVSSSPSSNSNSADGTSTTANNRNSTPGGPQPWRILLLLKAQCILYRRYSSILQEYKYAGYPLLLAAVELPENDNDTNGAHFLSEDIAPRLQAAAELCWLTCAASKLNGEELARSGGVHLMGTLLTRCISIMSVDVDPTDAVAVLATQALRAFACMTGFATARSEMESRLQVVDDILRACALNRAPSATDAALQCAIQLCRSEVFQNAFLQRGALGYFIPLLLHFDPTAIGGEGGGEEGNKNGLVHIFNADDEESIRGPEFLGLGVTYPNMQAARNHHAALAVRALAVLAGYKDCHPPSQPLPEAQAALSGLLTQTLAPRLVNLDPYPLLRDLNSSVSSPHVVWNLKMKEELLKIAETLRQQPGQECLSSAAQFTYEALKDELVVAGVYVRVYTEQPTFALDDSVAFCKGLVTTIYTLRKSDQYNSTHLQQCLTALSFVIDANSRLMGVLATKTALEPLLDCLQPVCERGHHQSITLLLNKSKDDVDQAASTTLDILLKLTSHAGCVEAMASPRCIMQIFWILQRPPSREDQIKCLNLLHALSSTPAAAWAASSHAGVFYLMEILLPAAIETQDDARTAQESSRVGAAAVLSRLIRQSLHGPRVVLWLHKILPPGLVAAIQDGPPEAAVAALAQPSETPERVWTTSMQRTAAEEVAHLASAARSAQARVLVQTSSSNWDWSPGEDYVLQYEGLRDELYVGGVYIRLYLKNPGHALRHPRAFLESLLEKYTAHATAFDDSSDGDKGDFDADKVLLLSAAAVTAIQNHPLLADHGVHLGYVPKLIRVLSSRVPPTMEHATSSTTDNIHNSSAAPILQPPSDISGSALRLLHALASASNAGEALARCSPPAVPVLASALQWGGAAGVLAVETLKRGLSVSNRSRDLLVGASLQGGLLSMLLHRLDWRKTRDQSTVDAAVGDEASDEAVQRVLFIDVVNLLALEGAYAAQVRSVLDNSEVWAAYRGQKHDLFLPAGGQSYTQGVAGLLRGPETARFALPAPETINSDKGGLLMSREREAGVITGTPTTTSNNINAHDTTDSPHAASTTGTVSNSMHEGRGDVDDDVDGGDKNNAPMIEEHSRELEEVNAIPFIGAPPPSDIIPTTVVEEEEVTTVSSNANDPFYQAPPKPFSPSTTSFVPATSTPSSQEISPSKAFIDPLSALLGSKNSDNNNDDD